MSGMLYFSDRPALSIQQADFVFVNNLHAQCLILEDHSLCFKWTTNDEYSRCGRAMSGMVHEITQRKLEVEQLKAEIDEAFVSCEEAVEGVSDDPGRLAAVSGQHGERCIKELESRVKLSYDVEHTQNSWTIQPGQTMPLPGLHADVTMLWIPQVEPVGEFAPEQAVHIERSSCLVGVAFLEGIGVQKDEIEGLRRCELATAHGDVLGRALVLIHGDNDGKKEGVRLLLNVAAESGDAVAQFWLGWCYKNGPGVATDAREAVRWYKLAADQGHDFAQKALARMPNASGIIFGFGGSGFDPLFNCTSWLQPTCKLPEGIAKLLA
jgi:hypothetical protein